MKSLRDETELYEEAKARCFTRPTSGSGMVNESLAGFLDGIRHVQNMDGRNDDQCKEENLFPRVLSESNDGFAIICGMMAVLEAKKGVGYKASWQRRGSKGVFTNIARKFDRIQNIMELNLEDDTENLCTNLADLAVYCIKEISRRREMNPKEFAVWVKEIRELTLGAGKEG